MAAVGRFMEPWPLLSHPVTLSCGDPAMCQGGGAGYSHTNRTRSVVYSQRLYARERLSKRQFVGRNLKSDWPGVPDGLG